MDNNQWNITWEEKEIKYVIAYIQLKELMTFLKYFATPAFGFPLYTVTTTYLGKWNNDKIEGKIRERHYSSNNSTYIEEKMRLNDYRYKHRTPIENKDTFKIIGKDLTPLNINIQYDRTPYETIDNNRITIDRNIRSNNGILFDDYILEVKGTNTDGLCIFLEGLLDIKPKKISKYKMAIKAEELDIE